MSALIPFGLFLKVGGNRENIAKWIFFPGLLAPLKVTTKVLLRLDADFVGFKATLICFQDVCDPLRVTDFEASIWPEDDCNPTVTLPEKVDIVGKR